MANIRIPKTFKLLGHTYTVRHVDHFGPLGANTLGTCEFGPQIITLKRSKDGEKLSRSSIEHTFLHELVHAIYQLMGENEMCKNESHVDMFAGLLHQALTTAS